MLWITILAALAAIASAVVSYLVYASQTHPDVVVYTDYDLKVPTIIYLVIENIGRSPARDVRFWSSRPIPEAAFGVTPEAVASRPKKVFPHGPLISGIPFLAPGASRRIMWGQYPGLFSALGEASIRITATYRSRQNDILDWQDHKTESVIEVVSYQTTEMGDNDSMRKIAKNVERIANTLAKQHDDQSG